MWHSQPRYRIPFRGAAQTRFTSNSGSVLNGVASYYGIFQHRFLSIVCPAAKVYDLDLGDFAALYPKFFRYYFDWGVGSPLLTYVGPVFVFKASTFRAFLESMSQLTDKYINKEENIQS